MSEVRVIPTWLIGAKWQEDSNGKQVIEMAVCGHCGRAWNDALITSLTPTPSGRCPFEYRHHYPQTQRERERYIHNDFALEYPNLPFNNT